MTHTPDSEATPAIGDRIRHEFDGGVLVSTITAIAHPQGDTRPPIYAVELPQTRDDELLLWAREFTVLGPEPVKTLTTAATSEAALAGRIAAGYGAELMFHSSVTEAARREAEQARAQALEAARPIRRGDTVLASIKFHPPVRGVVERIVNAGDAYFSTVVIRDDGGKTHVASLSRCRRVDAAEVDAERMRRLHEAATERAAAYRIALEAIAHNSASCDGDWTKVEYAARVAAEALAAAPEASAPAYPGSPDAFTETRDDGPPEDEPWLGGLRPDGSRR